MKITMFFIFVSSFVTTFGQFEWSGKYTLQQGERNWSLTLNPDSTYEQQIISPKQSIKSSGTWRVINKLLMLFTDQEQNPHSTYELKYWRRNGYLPWLKVKKLFGSRILFSRRFKLLRNKWLLQF